MSINSPKQFEGPGKQPMGPSAPALETMIPPAGNGSDVSEKTLKILGVPDSSKIPEAIRKGIEDGTLVETTEYHHSPED